MIGNLLAGAFSLATRSPFLAIHDPTVFGSLRRVALQGPDGFIEPIQVKRAGTYLQGHPSRFST